MGGHFVWIWSAGRRNALKFVEWLTLDELGVLG